MSKKSRTRTEREAYWRGVLSDWHSSGEQIHAYCQTHQISQSSFYLWRQRLYGKATSNAKAKFVAVELQPEPKVAKRVPIKLHLPNGCWISLERDFDVDTLSRLIEALGARHVNAA